MGYAKSIISIMLLTLAAGGARTAYGRSRSTFKNSTVKSEFAPAAAPKDQEVCFAPVENCAGKLLAFVATAKSRIDIIIYDFNLDQLARLLLDKSKIIPVRIVVDQKQAKGRHSLIPMLIKSGASVRYGHQRGIMHNKVTIIDGKMIETGSFNYTNHASQANNENQVYLANPSIVNRYKERFEVIWQEARSPK